MCFGLPLIFMGIHYISQGHRYDIIEHMGCNPTAVKSWVVVVTLYIPPIILTTIAMVYAGESTASPLPECTEANATDWDSYGTGNYEKCADCMVHSGYEASAVVETIRKPWRAAAQAMRGIRTEGPMAPEIPLDKQRPAEYVFSRHVESALKRIRSGRKPSEPA